MQSLRQYRRFGHHVEAQYQRDKEKASVRYRESEDPSPVASSPSRSTSDSEKAHHEPAEQYPSLTLTQTPGTALGRKLTGIEVRKRTTHEGGYGPDTNVFVVGYEGEHDILNPHNWPKITRWAATFNIALIGFIVGFASSVDSGALVQASEDFGVSEVVESLATGIFLIGFGVGALFAGPVSETVGRNPVYITTLMLYMAFILGAALAPNIGAQLVFRFLAGCFASTPLTCAGGSIADLWGAQERVYTFPIFANAAFLGPVMGPVVGGFIGESERVSWRWVEWVTLILSAAVLLQVALFQPETYAPILLSWKAKKLRVLTGDGRYRSEAEIRDVRFVKRLGHALYRPFLLTFSEPVIMLIALYLTVIYIILFTFLNGYTFIFTETYGFTQGITGLAFLGIALGLCLSTLLVPLFHWWAERDRVKILEAGGKQVPPEFKLLFGMFGAPAIPISMFWMGWTANPAISYWSPLAASVLFGYGILCVFISSYQYIIDSYGSYSASALASVTLIRYVVAGGMVEVAIPFYKNIGVHWTLTIMGCMSGLLVPVPYLFYIYGPKIRQRSKYAVDSKPGDMVRA